MSHDGIFVELFPKSQTRQKIARCHDGIIAIAKFRKKSIDFFIGAKQGEK